MQTVCSESDLKNSAPTSIETRYAIELVELSILSSTFCDELADDPIRRLRGLSWSRRFTPAVAVLHEGRFKHLREICKCRVFDNPSTSGSGFVITPWRSNMRLFMLVCALVLSGCPLGPAPREESHYVSRGDWPGNNQFVVAHDDFKKQISLRGPDTSDDDRKPSKICVRTVSEPAQHLFFRQIYFIMRATEWSFFDEVLRDDGSKLEFHKIDSKVEGGEFPWCAEYFAADIPDDVYTQAAETGLKIRLYGKRSTEDVEIPASYWQAYAAKEKEVLSPSTP